MAYYADISRYRPVKDWRLVKRNCPFLISKATEGRITQILRWMILSEAVRTMRFHTGCMPISGTGMNRLRQSF